MNVLVLEGGTSSERDVSLRSAKAVKTALQSAGHQVVSFDTREGLSRLAKYKSKVDVVFPALHGTEGEDGVVQKVLETHQLPYVGADSEVSRICFDKAVFKDHIKRLGILTPEGEVVTRGTIENHPLMQNPFVLKPVDGGSSINTHIVRDPLHHQLDFDEVFVEDPRMLIEALIEGTEITVSVLDGQALPVIEIIPPEGAEFNYENKYNGTTQELCPPQNVSEGLQKKAQQIAEQVHRELGVRHLSRTDFIIKNNELFMLEVNTIPGLTDESLFPKAAREAGMDMPAVADTLVRLAIS